jgi:amidase
MSDEPCLASAVQQAAWVASGELSARELTAAHLERIERLDGRVNAIPIRVPELALAAAEQADRRRVAGEPLGPLHGLPIAHKDLQDTAGVPTTYGSPAFADHVPDADSLLVARLREAGAIMLGKTNTPEWGAGSHTFNPVFGATRNPWDVSRSAGGSSGGAAAALACRMLPIADGSDLGGSLRNPAAWNGVLGMRPTPGALPRSPFGGWLPFSVDGPMARTAGDLALLWGAMTGGPVRLSDSVRDRRAAWSPTLGGLPVERSQLDALERALPVLAELGIELELDEPDLAGADEAFETVRALGFAIELGELADAEGERMKQAVRWNVAQGRALGVADLARAAALHAALGERMRLFFERYDYLLCPVTQLAPFPIEQEYPAEVAGRPMGSYIEWMRSCSRITMTGGPAISIPAGFTPDGLPVGLQAVARPFAEASLIELARSLAEPLGEPGLPSAVG